MSLFKAHNQLTQNPNGFFEYPKNMHKLGTVFISTNPTSPNIQNGIEIQEINYDELLDIRRSPLTSPTQENTIYIRTEDGLKIFPSGGWSANKIVATYIKKPVKVEWGYVVTNEQALYNASASQNFELHGSEEPTLVMKILGLAGIVLQKSDLTTVGQQQQA